MMTRRRAVAALATTSGAQLAVLVARLSADLGELTDAERLELVQATARLDAWSASMRARAINGVYESARAEMAAEADELAQAQARADQARVAAGLPAERRSPTVAGMSHAYDDQRLLHRCVAAEVSLVLGVSTWAADREVDLARDLAAHPPLARALADGLLDRAQARVICAGLRDLSEPDPATQQTLRGRMLARLLGPDDSPDGDDFDPDEPVCDTDDRGQPVGVVRELMRDGASLWSLVPGKLTAILAREAVRLDPESAAAPPSSPGPSGGSTSRPSRVSWPSCTYAPEPTRPALPTPPWTRPLAWPGQCSSQPATPGPWTSSARTSRWAG